MDNNTLLFLLSLAGTIIVLLIAITGYFLRIVHADTKKAIEDCGKNKGNIELLQQQLNSDVKRIEQTTQLELQNLARTVHELSGAVNNLVKVQLEYKSNKDN